MNPGTSEKYDAMVLGAGPAGLSAAMTLANRGWRVCVVEKTAFPREKVCGGFIGPENKKWLQDFRLLEVLEGCGAQRISRLRMTTSRGTDFRMPIQSAGRSDFGYGMCRKDFDHVLHCKLKELGVEVYAPVIAEYIERKEDGHLFRIKHPGINEHFYLAACHVLDARGLTSYNSFRPGRDAIGIAALFENVSDMNGDVILHFVDGGHFGMNPVSAQLTNVCYVADSRLCKIEKGDPEKIFDRFCSMNQFVDQQMKKAKRITAWKGIGIPRPRKLQYFDGSFFRIGDALTAVNPVVGGGISMAFASGVMLATILSQTSAEKVNVSRVTREYKQCWEARFQWKVRLSRFWGVLSHQAFAADVTLRILSANSWIFQKIFDIHHVIDGPRTHLLKEKVIQ